jgi:hypothetical protein
MSARVAIALLAAILGAWAIAPARAEAQAFEGLVTAKITLGEGGREAREVHYALRPGLVRIEMPGRGDARSVMIMDQTAKTTTMLMPAMKKYMVMPIPENTGEPREATRPPGEVVRTGKKETIAGYECEHWVVKGGEHDVDACVAAGLGAFTMPARGRESAWTSVLRDQRGFPLKVARDGNTIMEVTKIEKKPLDASLFTPPSDYERMEMPAGAGPRPRPRQP